MLNAFADAAQRVVPVVRKRRVSGEREGVAVAERSSGTGYREYEAQAVRTTRMERRGFESERSTGISLLRELGGALEAVVESVEEVFGGRTRSAVAAARRAACRRRWGRSWVEGCEREGDTGGFEASFEVAIEPDSGIVDVRAPLLELVRAFSSRRLAERYPARSRDVAATAA
jgi:hypothetical protein